MRTIKAYIMKNYGTYDSKMEQTWLRIEELVYNIRRDDIEVIRELIRLTTYLAKLKRLSIIKYEPSNR